ncbi:MAG: HD domain-containing protein [Lachnospiraceae bacterium]|nr:HD domain-containing protein [Lachnospiraceae bacterium]
MNQINIMLNNVKIGMKISEDVYSDSKLLVQKDTVVNDAVLGHLKYSSVESVPVYADKENEYMQTPFVPVTVIPGNQKTHSEKIRESETFKNFEANFQKKAEEFSTLLKDIADGNTGVDVEQLYAFANEIIAGETNTYRLMDTISHLHYFDSSTYAHSLHVAMLAYVLGCWLHLDEERLKILTVAGMLHDVGKLLMPEEIINKPDKLTDEEYKIIQQHPYKGYQLLLSQKVDRRISETALLHHEKCDGTGYPMGLKSEGINKFAKVIAIVDVYEAMTANRAYRNGLCPFAVIRMYEDEGYAKYDPNYLLPFLQGIADTYLHNNVLLSDGRQGKIVMTNKTVCSKPGIMVGDEYVDLALHPELSIVSIL